MTAHLSTFITQTLLDSGGSLNFKILKDQVSRSLRVTESALSRFLLLQEKVAIKDGGGSIGPSSLIVAKTSLRLCQRKECPQCDRLHLCRYYVCGGCTYGQECRNKHSLSSPYNAELLKRHGLQDLTEKQVLQLLLQNDPYLLPEICSHYNKGNGLHGSCRFTAACNKLHVCQHYCQGDCKFGSSCKRNHDFGHCGMKVLRGFSRENIEKLNDIYRNKFIIMGAQENHAAAAELKVPSVNLNLPGSSSACLSNTKSEADRNEICLYFLRGQCTYKEKCARVHWPLPYRWQVLDQDAETWKDLPNMEDTEKAYCDPGSSKNLFIDFMTMMCRGSPVRRLSTASSVSKPPHYILTTQWLWYWKNEDDVWLEFGQGENSASVTSRTLENVYLADRDTEVQFSAGKHQYVLNFKGDPGTEQMYQQNISYKTKREVRRRPHFLSAQDVKLKLKSPSSCSPSSLTAKTFPSQWDKTALPHLGYKLVLLSQSAEYNMLEMLFKRTMPESLIHSIHRIQNPSLWTVFQWQKEQMKKRNGDRAVNQQYLFHGTEESLIEAICEQNFDWRMCGVHGTSFGKGSYFARDASYSNRFAKVNKHQKKSMFVALVLVGEYTRGSSSYVRPPPKAHSKTLYDSCVDRESDPSIYVIFEKHQIYPEYLISYS